VIALRQIITMNTIYSLLNIILLLLQIYQQLMSIRSEVGEVADSGQPRGGVYHSDLQM
jgi:hypothetical protein